MNQPLLYKDALMKNSDKTFEISKRRNVIEYSKRDIKKICTSGDLVQLKKIPLRYFNEETISFLLKTLKEKILEIELWKCEDQNQLFGKLEELNARIISINECYSYIESIII